VDPTTFEQKLDNPEATLADVLKPSIAGEKDEYEVYVELPANEGKGFCASSLFLPPGSAKKQRTLAVSLPSLDALTALRKSVQRSIHERPQGPPFVGRTHEATQLVGEIKSRGFDPDQRGVGCLKNHTPVFEYGTMSGAGKSTWGFEIERVLRNEFAMCAVKAIFLNFYGGTGSGGSDKGAFGRPEITEARELWDAETSKAQTAVAARIACARAKTNLKEAKSKAMRVAAKDDLELKKTELSTQLSLLEGAKALADGRMEEAIKPSVAQLLFARGALETSSAQAGNLFDFSSISIAQVIDLLCQQQAQEEKKSGEVILYVHLDEAAQIHPAIVKAVVYSLLNYNTGTRKGWIPIMTHTAPFDWNPMTTYPLCSLPLYPLTLEEMRSAAGWTQEVATDRLLSCTGGHASLLRKLLGRCETQPMNPTGVSRGWDAVFD